MLGACAVSLPYVGWLLVSFLDELSSCRGRKSWMLYFDFAEVNCVLCLFFTALWVGLQPVIVAFFDHTHLPFSKFFHLHEVEEQYYQTVECDLLCH